MDKEMNSNPWKNANQLKTFTMKDLYEIAFRNRPAVIEDLLCPGTYIFVGSPKIGKSYLVLQFAYHVATGIPLWQAKTKKGTVLYLALEDNQRRLQSRLYRMYGVEYAENLHMATRADTVSEGLIKQLKSFIMDHPDTALIIIDTLQRIREADDTYNYADDYEIVKELKDFTDTFELSLIVVHHTRKQKSLDKFEMISGSNGLFGAADGALLLYKNRRSSGDGVLEVTGRDQQDVTIGLKRDPDHLYWVLDQVQREFYQEKKDPLLEQLASFITPENPKWEGTATELVSLLGLDLKPNTLSMKLNVNTSVLFNEYDIEYEKWRGHGGRRIRLRRLNGLCDGRDGRDDGDDVLSTGVSSYDRHTEE